MNKDSGEGLAAERKKQALDFPKTVVLSVGGTLKLPGEILRKTKTESYLWWK